MFRDSLVETDENRRKGKASRTAEFLGTAARGAIDSGPEKSVARQMGELLKEMSSFIPSNHKYPIRAGGLVLIALGNDKSPKTWTREYLNELMHRIYESINPPPKHKPQSAAMTDYENAYRAWAEEPLNTYSSIRADYD